jgi:hypothetical protein
VEITFGGREHDRRGSLADAMALALQNVRKAILFGKQSFLRDHFCVVAVVIKAKVTFDRECTQVHRQMEKLRAISNNLMRGPMHRSQDRPSSERESPNIDRLLSAVVNAMASANERGPLPRHRDAPHLASADHWVHVLPIMGARIVLIRTRTRCIL